MSWLPRLAFDYSSGWLQGFLLWVCLWWAIVSGQGWALRREPAWQPEMRAEPAAVKAREHQQSNRETDEAISTPIAQIKAMRIRAGRGDGARRVMTIALPQRTAGDKFRTSRRSRCGGCSLRGAKGDTGSCFCKGTGDSCLLAAPQKARCFRFRPRFSDSRVAKWLRRTDPRQIAPVVRAPPCACSG